MKKRFIQAAAAIALTALLGGCYPSGQDPIGNSDIGHSVINNSEQITDSQSSPPIQISDKFILDLNKPDNIPDEIPEIKLTLKTWSKEEIEQLFLSDKQIVTENEHDEQFHPGEKMYFWQTEDRLNIAIEPGRFYYADDSELDGEYKYGKVYNHVQHDCALIDDCYATNDELSAFSHEDAEKRVEEMLGKLEITNFGKPRIIAVHSNLANKILSDMEGHADKAGEPFKYTPWTENEDIYPALSIGL